MTEYLSIRIDGAKISPIAHSYKCPRLALHLPDMHALAQELQIRPGPKPPLNMWLHKWRPTQILNVQIAAPTPRSADDTQATRVAGYGPQMAGTGLIASVHA